MSVQEGVPESRLVQWQEKDNCHRGANFLRAIDELAEHLAQLEKQHQVFVPEPHKGTRIDQDTLLRTRGR